MTSLARSTEAKVSSKVIRKNFEKDIYAALYGEDDATKAEILTRLDTLLPDSKVTGTLKNHYKDATQEMKSRWASISVSKQEDNSRAEESEMRKRWMEVYQRDRPDMTDDEKLIFDCLHNPEEGERDILRKHIDHRFDSVAPENEQAMTMKLVWDIIHEDVGEEKLGIREKRRLWWSLMASLENSSESTDTSDKSTETGPLSGTGTTPEKIQRWRKVIYKSSDDTAQATAEQTATTSTVSSEGSSSDRAAPSLDSSPP